MSPLDFVLPGSIEQRTGGYVYDARLVAELRRMGRDVRVHELADDFPNPSEASRAAAAELFDSFADASLVLTDALAGSVLPAVMARHRERLRLVSLLHHPLALETGVDADTAAELERDESAALACVRHVVCTSGATAATLLDYGIHSADITIAEPGTDSAPLARGSSPGEPFRWLCVATLTPRKGHDVLIEAFAALRERCPERAWTLELVGSQARSSATTAAVREAIARHALHDHVSLAGELDAAALAERYRCADAFVLASRHEGFGMVLTEAISYGLPIVATIGGAVVDTVPPAAGMLVAVDDVAALSDALEEVSERAGRYERLRAGALQAREGLLQWRQTARRVNEALQLVESAPS